MHGAPYLEMVVRDQTDCFKEEFKRYKKRDLDLSGVIDFTGSQQYDRKVQK